MMRLVKCCLALLVLTLPMVVQADSPAPERPWVKTSEGGDFFFKMVPSKWRVEGDKIVIEREAFGVAYEISENGDFNEVWRTEGWYTFQGYLSEEGRYFVRFGPWASDQENHTDLAIAFYDRGKLLKEYQVKDLIKKPDLLDDSVSHYMWRPEIQSKPNGFDGGTFHLVMIDKTTYDFDYQTGEIATRGTDKDAKGYREIRAEEQADANKRGEELLKASAFKEEFERHFEISGAEALRGSYSGCSLAGPAWTADFTPRQKFDHEAGVRAVFPIREGERVEASLTPQEITSAIEKAFKHPFVSKRFEDGIATGIRLRIQGDRLHWDTPELQEFIEKIFGEKPKDDELAHWAYFIIDDDDHNYYSIYLNTKSGEIIDVDESNWPWEPFLIDATGKRQDAKKAAKPEGGPKQKPEPEGSAR